MDNKLIQILIIFAAASLFNTAVVNFGSRQIKRRLSAKRPDMAEKYATSIGVIKTFFIILVYTCAVMLSCQIIFGISASTLITATGAVSVIVGLGAQSIVKDTICGFFFLLEDQYRVGDLVTIENFLGTVESMTVRVTTIINFQGDRLIIPNGNITMVINHSRDPKTVFAVARISYAADINKALAALAEMCETVDFPMLTEKPKVLGVTELGITSVSVTVTAVCEIADRYAAERSVLLEMASALKNAGVRMPTVFE